MPGQIRTLLDSVLRKPATAPDQKTESEALGVSKEEKTSIIHDVLHSGKNAKFVLEALPQLASGEPLDDKKYLLEHGVSLLQTLPLNSGLSSTVSDGFIKMLYHDLPHPSTTIAGPTTRYRRHDGGNNNIWNPEMGKAGTPYARNVPPMKPKGRNLPDPELVWEQLLKRPDDKFKEHPSGLNRLFFSFATIVIHECFQTNRKNQWINETSSYVDLSTLYGNTEEEQPRVRTYNNGTIYPDAIASDRIMLMPPGVVALLILFSSNHNTMAKDLLCVNEDGKYKDWDDLNEAQQKWQDNDIFQLSRNINVGFFATVVLKDYVSAILNTPRADSTWSLDLGKEIKSAGQRVERGTGNVVSVEFAVLYHWHAALSAADAKWMEDVIRWNLPHLKSLDDITPRDFMQIVAKEGKKLEDTLPRDWTFSDLKRGPDGRFSDERLAELIKDCIEEPAHAFGAHGTPASLKIVDILGQMQARDVFNVCTLNEFRAYLNLKPYDTFEDWCEDKDTARAAELLYSHIDNLELYPGLMAECTKPPMPGSGVCPGQTTGRGILDDAVALVRGDRFLSYDFNSTTLTNWGVSKLGDLPSGAYGGMLPRVIFNGLPSSFTGTSAYALLPFYTPKAVQGILKGNGVIDQYDLKRPPQEVKPAVVYTEEGCRSILEDSDTFRSSYALPKILQGIFYEDHFETHVSQFFSANAAKQIKQSSLKYAGARRAIDIVRDVANVTPIAWLADRYALPLKTPNTPRGIFSLPELFEMFKVTAAYHDFNVIPADEWKLRAGAQKSIAALRQVLELHIKVQGGGGLRERIADHLEQGTAYEVGPEADRLFDALFGTKKPHRELADECINEAALVASTLTQQAALLIDLFLSPGYEAYKARIIELAHRDDEASVRELQGFVYEGMRHTGVGLGITRVAARDAVVEDGAYGSVTIKAHQKVLAATAIAAMDQAAFPAPEKLDTTRPRESYATILGPSPLRIAGPAIAAMLKEVMKLKNVRRAGGSRGQFTTVEQEFAGIRMRTYLDSNAKESPYPTNLMLEYEEDIPQMNGVNGHM
ncbi:hypothetical protein LTS10_000788 [Elasticomyces elasticus]|nr:hypothetical protein LTS10_000788 [Elasticomyces elasticus]